MPADIQPNLRIEHNGNDEPILVDESTDPSTTIIINQIGSGGGGGASGGIGQIYTSGITYWDAEETNNNQYFELESGDALDVTRIQFHESGGGSENTDVVAEVYDTDDGSVIDSTTLNTDSTAGGTSVDAAGILIRVDNSSASGVEASVTVQGAIE